MSDDKKTDSDFTMEQLLQEIKELKEINKGWAELVDNYHKELTETTDVLEKTTNALKEAQQTIENFYSVKIERIDENN